LSGELFGVHEGSIAGGRAEVKWDQAATSANWSIR
jgi:hypothetical protein